MNTKKMGCCSSNERDVAATKEKQNESLLEESEKPPKIEISSLKTATKHYSVPLVERSEAVFKNVDMSSDSPIDKDLLEEMIRSSSSDENVSEFEDEGGISGELDSSDDS